MLLRCRTSRGFCSPHLLVLHIRVERVWSGLQSQALGAGKEDKIGRRCKWVRHSAACSAAAVPMRNTFAGAVRTRYFYRGVREGDLNVAFLRPWVGKVAPVRGAPGPDTPRLGQGEKRGEGER